MNILRCEPCLGATKIIPEAQDAFFEGDGLAFRMETDVPEFVSVSNLSRISNIHTQD
jgi:hypothetical protein